MGKETQGKKKEEEQDKRVLVVGSGLISPSSLPCGPDQCTNMPVTQTTFITDQLNNGFSEAIVNYIMHAEDESGYLSGLLPDSLLQMLKEAATKGFLFSFLLTLTDKILTQCLKAEHFSDEQIYWANQTIRYLTVIAIGGCPEMAILALSGSYLLTQMGCSKNSANYITTGSLLALDMLGNPLSLVENSLILVTSIGGALAGSIGAQKSYNLMHRFFRPEAEKVALAEYTPADNMKAST
jgi:hypothetical protein